MEKLFSVSEAARDLGKSVDWLRQAERKGKIPTAKRDLNGWRVYSSDDISSLHNILLPKVRAQSRH